MLSDYDLEQIEQRWAQATPGPWTMADVVDTGYRSITAQCEGGWASSTWTKTILSDDGLTVEDAIAIAAAPTDIAALLAHIRERG